MRKTIVIVTLLVMLAVSCENGSVAEKAEYTEDGQRLVTLKVNTGGTAGGRSLTNALVKEKANYMEVIFKRGIKFYRATGSVFEQLSITIPAGEYTTSEAIMLIGRVSDKTLLATGALSAGVNVQTNNQEITFLVAILNTNTSTEGTTKFTIDATGASPAFPTTFSGKLDKGLINGLPCFQVPTVTSGIKASLSFTTGFANTGALINVASIPAPTVTFTGSPAISGTDVSVTAPTTTVGDGTIAFTFDSKAAGNYVITFNIPVKGFGDDAKGLTWNIRGGTKLVSAADFGDDEGEGVRLVVTAAPADPEITVVMPPPPVIIQP